MVRGAGKISKTPLSLDSISVDQDDEKEILGELMEGNGR